ncbi:hypothetical protein EXIGLDRAFT_768834 [Exidia glandulosa HHB12029]|uniref:Uncharacterized protein n=1 Tax=Exidia glandulosa HHB12029 TaxID=1314781 RepID=A0A165HY09_EXIGL|nr:hypothetical protein EXIGLDRAFT_768834 [Exidia glandulosa HHB12029]
MRAAALAHVLLAGTLLVSGKNITVDDTSPQWSFTPKVGVWGVISKEEPCVPCQSQPDADRAFAGTWHDATGEGSAILSFTGVGATVYAICPGPHAGGEYSLSLSFLLDGVTNGTFVDTPCPGYTYNYMIYHVSGLARQEHTIEIANHFHDTPLTTSNILLDYAVVYDGDEEASSGGNPINAAAIVLPVILGVSLIVLGLWLYLRKRIQPKARIVTESEPKPLSAYPESPYELRSHGAPSMYSSEPTLAEPVPPLPAHYNSRAAVPPRHDGVDTELEAAFSVIMSRARGAGSHSIASSPSKRGNGIERRGTQVSESADGHAPPSYTDTLSPR